MTVQEEKLLQKEPGNLITIKKEKLLSKLQNLCLFTINHKTAPVTIREKFAIPDYSLNEAIQNLKTYKLLSSFIILSTCNRTEIYFTSKDSQSSLSDIYSFFSQYLGLEEKIAKEYSTLIKESGVVNYIFKVASGLDSQVLGESQVLSQVKHAYSLAQKENTLDNTLEKLFQFSIKAAKEVHKKTNLSKNSQSISSAAIDLANKVCGPLKTKNVMVLGAGTMAKLALEHILKIGGSKETIVLNRSPHRVIEFSEKYKISKSVPFENIYETLNEIDILICAAGAPHFIIFAEQFKEIRKDPSKPLYIFDIAMPRNVDSEFGKLGNVKLFDIDGLQENYKLSLSVQDNEIKEAENILEENKNKLLLHLAQEKVDSLIKELKEKAENIRKDKLANLKGTKSTFTLEELDYITKNIINTLLHEQIQGIKKSGLEKRG